MATTVPDVVTPADWVPGPRQGEWTYDDYMKLPQDGRRYEILRRIFSGKDTLPSKVVPNFPVHVEQFFEE